MLLEDELRGEIAHLEEDNDFLITAMARALKSIKAGDIEDATEALSDYVTPDGVRLVP